MENNLFLDDCRPSEVSQMNIIAAVKSDKKFSMRSLFL